MQIGRKKSAIRVQKHRRKAGVSVIQSHCMSVNLGLLLMSKLLLDQPQRFAQAFHKLCLLI